MNTRIQTLHIKLLHAQNLPPADLDGLADPFVVFQLEGDRVVSGRRRHTLHPVWNEEIVFTDVHPHAEVNIEVWDEDGPDNELLGTQTLRVCELAANGYEALQMELRIPLREGWDPPPPSAMCCLYLWVTTISPEDPVNMLSATEIGHILEVYDRHMISCDNSIDSILKVRALVYDLGENPMSLPDKALEMYDLQRNDKLDFSDLLRLMNDLKLHQCKQQESATDAEEAWTALGGMPDKTGTVAYNRIWDFAHTFGLRVTMPTPAGTGPQARALLAAGGLDKGVTFDQFVALLLLQCQPGDVEADDGPKQRWRVIKASTAKRTTPGGLARTLRMAQTAAARLPVLLRRGSIRAATGGGGAVVSTTPRGAVATVVTPPALGVLPPGMGVHAQPPPAPYSGLPRVQTEGKRRWGGGGKQGNRVAAAKSSGPIGNTLADLLQSDTHSGTTLTNRWQYAPRRYRARHRKRQKGDKKGDTGDTPPQASRSAWLPSLSTEERHRSRIEASIQRILVASPRVPSPEGTTQQDPNIQLKHLKRALQM